jgi:outer membrane protein TolC
LVIVTLFAAADPLPPPTPVGPATMPIDLPTALRLVNANSPTIALARARIDEAYANQQQAEVLMLPNLQAGVNYYRLDGRTQNQRGEVFTTSRSNLFSGAGAALRLDLADALFLPLAARRLTEAAAAAARATTNTVQLDVALANWDLVETYGRLAINADTLARAEETLRRAEAAEAAGLSKTKGDANRVRTEVELRRTERHELEGRAGVASARLAQLLLLEPGVELVPADVSPAPVTMVPPAPVEQLVATALAARPELAAGRAVNAAAGERLRQARFDPFVPKFQLDYTGGAFGGGRNDFVGDFSGRGVFGAAAVWELQNLGAGNRAEIRGREASVSQSYHRLRELEAQVGAEVAAAARTAAARKAGLPHAEEAVRQAIELYRKLLEFTFGMAGPQRQFDALEPFLAIQGLNQARVQHLLQIVDHNRAQFRLLQSLGQ